MIEKLLYATIAAATLAGTPGCKGTENHQMERQRERYPSYSNGAALEDSVDSDSRQQAMGHIYRSGIKAWVMYQKGPGNMMSVRIEVKEDPNNIIGRSISASGRPQDIIYEIMVDGPRTMKAVTSRIDGLMVRMISEGSDKYLKVGQKGFLIRLPMGREDRKVFGRVEACLDVHGLIQKANSMEAISSKDQWF